MAARIYTLVQRKGGVSKSTTAICLAGELHRRGLRTLLVDADHQQGSALSWSDIAAEKEVEGPTTVALGEGLGKQLPQLTPAFERVVVDTPGRIGKESVEALSLSDVAIIPTSGSPLDLEGAAQTSVIVRGVQDYRPHLGAVVLLTRVDTRTALSRGASEALAPLEMPILKARLSSRAAFQELAATGLSMHAYAANTAAAREVEALVSELEEIES